MRTYAGDLLDRLVPVTAKAPAADDNTKAEFEYDAGGRRTVKRSFTWDGAAWQLSKSIRFVYDGWNLLAEFEALGAADEQLARTYAWGLGGKTGGMLAVTDHTGVTPQTYLPIHDGGGSVVGLADAATGAVVASYRWDAWGNLLSAIGPAANACPIGFQGGYRDAEGGGMIERELRVYLPWLGVFASRDPIAEAGGYNLYSYAGNDPVNRSDPTGLEPTYVGKAPSFDEQVTALAEQDFRATIEFFAATGNPVTDAQAERLMVQTRNAVARELLFPDIVAEERAAIDRLLARPQAPRGPDVMTAAPPPTRGDYVRGVIGVVNNGTANAVDGTIDLFTNIAYNFTHTVDERPGMFEDPNPWRLDAMHRLGETLQSTDLSSANRAFGHANAERAVKVMTVVNGIVLWEAGSVGFSGLRSFQAASTRSSAAILESSSYVTAGAPGARVTVGGVRATELAGRLTDVELATLQRVHGTEFALIYRIGKGVNGGGGTYYLIQGTAGTVSIPVGSNIRLIAHTHPERLHGAVVPLRPSGMDRTVMRALERAGSPQRVSKIVPEVGQSFTFTK